MASSNGIQTITIYILPNISRSKGNQTKKFGQIVERNLRRIFLQKSCKKWDKRLVADLILFLKTALYEVNCVKFQAADSLEKGLGLVSPTHFLYDDFSREISLMLYSINKPNFVTWLP